MRNIPIIYSAPMIKALLREVEKPGTGKTMTRRLAWREAPVWSEGGIIPDGGGGQMDYVEPHWVTKGKPAPWQKVEPGDRLWVRENWKPHSLYTNTKPREIPRSPVFYAADDAYAPSNTPWVPCIHMPRWVSRLTQIVTATKIERLQDISDADALAEGVEKNINNTYGVRGPLGGWLGNTFASPREAFHYLWMALHGAASWDANPEVVALTTKVHKANIDALKEAA